MPCVTYAWKNPRKNPEILYIITVPMEIVRIPVNRIVIIVIWRGSPTVHDVK